SAGRPRRSVRARPPSAGEQAPSPGHAEARSLLGQGEGKGGGEGGVVWLVGAAETARRNHGSRDVVVCSGLVSVRGLKLATPGRLLGGMSRDPTGRNHIHHERGSGRGTLGLTKNAARPGTDSAISASPREPKLRVSV